STHRLLERAAETNVDRQSSVAALAARIGPGTVLIREWLGVRHRVTVLADGVLLRGARYHSLSGWRARSLAAAGPGRGSSGCEHRARGASMEPAKPLLRRCAIYTRKSSAVGQDGLRRWRDLGCVRLMEDLGRKQVVKVHRLKGSGSACSSQKEPL